MSLFSNDQSNRDNPITYLEDVLRYPLFKEVDQNNEYHLEIENRGILFIPKYPLTFEINEAFYSRVYDAMSLALMPQYTLIRPSTMQVVTLPRRPLSEARALLFPMRKGQPKRLVESMAQLLKRYYQTGEIPLMDQISWNYSKSPHALITGVSGSGKSYLMKIIYQICSQIGLTVAVDPKLSDLARIAKKMGTKDIIIPDFAVDGDAANGIGGRYIQEVVKLLKKVEATMYDRQKKLYEASVSASTDYRELGLKPIFIFIDELAALLTGAGKTVREDFQNTLTRLVVLGREAGVYLVICMQSARAEYINTLVRDQVSLRIQLGRLDKDNTKFLFPSLSSMPMIPMGGKGTGIVSISGDDRYAGIEPIATPTVIGD